MRGDCGVIFMAIEHNVFVVNGLEYKAVKAKSGQGCDDCELYKHVDKFGDCDKSCTPIDRKDKCNVIFKRHYRPTHKELQK